MKKIRIAVIGKGRWGKRIIATLQKLPGCTVSYIVSHDYKKLLTKKDIDAVIVATPTETHARIALQFVQKSIPTFIEKPMARSVKDAMRLLQTARKNKTIVFVGHTQLYNPAYRTTKKLLKTLGSIHSIVTEGGNNSHTKNASVLWEWGPHEIYMALDLLESEPLHVQAWSIGQPHALKQKTACMRLVFKNAVVLTVNSWEFGEKQRRVVINGANGSVVFDDTKEKKVILYTHQKTYGQFKISYPQYATTPPLTLELKTFLSAVRKKTLPKTDAESGLSVVRILESAEKSIKKNGSPVSHQPFMLSKI